MIGNNKVVVIIPARGGSKGIPKKNIKLLNGKPLIQYSIDIAKKSKYVDSVVVSTDCDEIEKISLELGSQVVKRPDYLSKDESLVAEAIKYTINMLDEKYDFIILLEPTSPMRTLELVNNCIENLAVIDTECLATFCETDLPPARIWKLTDKKAEFYFEDSNPWLPRQRLEKGYQLNGLVYGLKTHIFMKTNNDGRILTNNITPILTKREKSIDIDNIIDFKLIELLMKENNE